jgi:hypothetical protein
VSDRVIAVVWDVRVVWATSVEARRPAPAWQPGPTAWLLHLLRPTFTPPPATPHTGGLLSGALFQYPGAFIMTAVGVFAAQLLANPSGALNGVASGACVCVSA